MSRRILRLAEVLARTGYSKSTLRRKELAGEVGRRLRLGPNSVGWYEDEIEAHVASRPRMPLPESKEEEVLRVGCEPRPERWPRQRPAAFRDQRRSFRSS
jgi:prophage regulatory protein